MTKKLLMFLLPLVFVFGCTKDFEDINKNPNSPIKVDPGYILANAQKKAIDVLRDEWFGGRTTQLCAQYWAQRNYTDEDRYAFRTTVVDAYWRNAYQNMMDLKEIIRLNTDEATKVDALSSGANANQIAAATILLIWQLQILTDTFGDVPYSTAFLSNENRQPTYDTQQSLYAKMLTELEAAVNMIDLTKDGLTKGDMMFGGDMMKWKKFGNAMRLRVALRMSKRDNAVAAKAILAAVPATDFPESNDDNAAFKYLGDGINNGPVYEAIVTSARNDFTIAKPFAMLLQGKNDVANSKTNPFVGLLDPRLNVFATPVNGEIVGMPYGVIDEVAKAWASKCPDWAKSPSIIHEADYAYMYMDYAEYCFMRSELTNWDQAWYIKGVKASMDYWGVSAADRDAYANALPAASQATVLTQKYIALYMQPEQAWAEYRRTGFPKTLLHPGEISVEANGTVPAILFVASEGVDIPRRVFYPVEENNINKNSYQAAVKAQGADDNDTELWWTK